MGDSQSHDAQDRNHAGLMPRRGYLLALVVLVVVLLGSVVLLAERNSRLPEEYRWTLLLPRSQWGFGPDPDTYMRIIMRERLVARRGPTQPQRYKIGFFSLRVK